MISLAEIVLNNEVEGIKKGRKFIDYGETSPLVYICLDRIYSVKGSFSQLQAFALQDRETIEIIHGILIHMSRYFYYNKGNGFYERSVELGDAFLRERKRVENQNFGSFEDLVPQPIILAQPNSKYIN